MGTKWRPGVTVCLLAELSSHMITNLDKYVGEKQAPESNFGDSTGLRKTHLFVSLSL